MCEIASIVHCSDFLVVSVKFTPAQKFMWLQALALGSTIANIYGSTTRAHILEGVAVRERWFFTLVRSLHVPMISYCAHTLTVHVTLYNQKS